MSHKAKPFEAHATKSATWNCGAYLVEGLGHSSAPVITANAPGAEKAGAYLAGGFAEGWEAPPLTSLSHAPVPWNEDEIFAYLRTGDSSRLHGVAAGPMVPGGRSSPPCLTRTAPWRSISRVVQRRMAEPAQAALAAQLEKSTLSRVASASPLGARLYEGACAVCHAVGGAPLFGSRPSLALNSNLHMLRQSDPGDCHGIASPAVKRSRLHARLQGQHDRRGARRAGVLPQAAVAPEKPAWTGVRAAVTGPGRGIRADLPCRAETALVAGLPGRGRRPHGSHRHCIPNLQPWLAVRSLLDTDFYKLLMLQMIREFYPDQHTSR